jgi:hypothetical protein
MMTQTQSIDFELSGSVHPRRGTVSRIDPAVLDPEQHYPYRGRSALEHW